MSQLTHCPSCGDKIMPDAADFKETRTAAGLTQRDMAKLLGVKASHVAYLESGHRHPSGELILKFNAVRDKLAARTERKAVRTLKQVHKRMQQQNKRRPKSKVKKAA